MYVRARAFCVMCVRVRLCDVTQWKRNNTLRSTNLSFSLSLPFSLLSLSFSLISYLLTMMGSTSLMVELTRVAERCRNKEPENRTGTLGCVVQCFLIPICSACITHTLTCSALSLSLFPSHSPSLITSLSLFRLVVRLGGGGARCRVLRALWPLRFADR